ncbi:MAG: aconitase family protein, partial [Nitrospira sp.]|nr:aconitase family protein [Nitrospira sp.]
ITFFRVPETVKFELTGHLPKGVYPKDIILYLISQYGVSYMTNCVAEFAGEGAKTIDMEGRMTICNMMAEFGGTTGMFYPDEQTLQYLKYRNLGIDKNSPDAVAYRKSLEVRSDEEILTEWRQLWPDPDAHYKAAHQLDLSTLEPVVTALADHPKDDKPSLGQWVSRLAGGKIHEVFIGSCTNGRISDLRVVAEILKGRTVHPEVPLVIVPATTEVSRLCMTEGLTEIFMEAGALVDTPSCSMCLGMKSVVPAGHVCASSSNRNFPGRMGRGARAQLMSPATAAASAVKGVIADPREFLN